jgi:hypothetical protein
LVLNTAGSWAFDANVDGDEDGGGGDGTGMSNAGGKNSHVFVAEVNPSDSILQNLLVRQDRFS